MKRLVPLWSVSTATLLLGLLGQPLQAEPAKPKGLGDPGVLNTLKIEPELEGNKVVIRGRDARQQLVVTGVYSSGQFRDQTHAATYVAQPAGLIEIAADGMVTPLKDGDVTVTAKVGDKTTTVAVHVEGLAVPVPINFTNQITPIFTKLGCNSGGCHGKASGQNGFKLSLLGFVPDEDYEYLVRETRGRRLFPSSPADSLLLLKATGKSPHGGGKRMEVGSYEYRIISRWIEQGMPFGSATDPVVTGIECLPKTRLMDRGTNQQITVLAKYSDGTSEDVTRTALFEANDSEMAEATATGLIKTLDLTGEVAIMARYQGQVSTFRATIPLGADTSKIPAPSNFVDAAVFSKLKLLGIPPSELCDDSTFLRRAHIDITGTMPNELQVREFLADQSADKREKLVDRLLDSDAYADLFANKWNLVLRNKKRAPDDLSGTYSFYRWIWDNLNENKPYDQFVREIVTASGEQSFNPAVVWYREVNELNEQVEDTAQLFLGLRIQCARCHHHPFEKWSQDDYYGFAAFFSTVGQKNIPGAQPTQRDRRIFHNEMVAQTQNPKSKLNLKPTGLGSKAIEITPDRDPRTHLSDWLSRPDNPFFAKALVNRYWKHFFDRGIVEPEDDMRETNPPSNPELLNALSQNFVTNGFNLKWLVRTICTSKTYQLTALPNDYNLKDKQNYSRYYPKRLQAEVLYDGFHQVTSTTEGFSGLPGGTRAIQLPDPSVGPYFLKVFGQPQGDTACECERSQEANLAQSLHLLNSSEVQNKIGSGSGRAAVLAADKARIHDVKIQELYRWVYSREPSPDELKIAIAHIQKHEAAPKTAYEDIVWALINTKEFLFNH